MGRCADSRVQHGWADSAPWTSTPTLSHLNAEELREMVQSLRKTVTFKQAAIDKLTLENALLKRLKFAAQSE